MNTTINFKRFAIALATIALAGTFASDACTNLLVGKKASTDGSTMVTYADDSHTRYGYLQYLPAADHKPGEMRQIYDWGNGEYHGEIPEAAHTYSVVGNMNEHQLTIVETTWTGRKELVDTTAILDYGSLIYITLQRAKTAREAIETIAQLVKDYGYRSSGESFSIGDPNEVWIMDIIGKGGKSKGAVWVAQRIPDDCIAAHANFARTRQFPKNDKKNCLYSPDVISFARDMGYFTGKDADFDFANAYCPISFSGMRACEARVWAFFNRFTTGMDAYLPFINCEPGAKPMPLYVKPEKQLSLSDVREMMRDHFEGTPFDMTLDPGATMNYGVPYRWRPSHFKVDGQEYTHERAIATQQSAFVLVAQMRSWLPDAIGGVLWFANDDANTAVFVPMYCCMTSIPKSYSHGIADLYHFSTESAFWVANWVANQTYTRYSLMIDDVRKVQGQLEDYYAAHQPVIEAQALELMKTSPEKAIALLNGYSNAEGQRCTAAYKELAEYLLVKYLDGNRKREKDGKFEYNKWGVPVSPEFPGYNQEYFNAIIADPQATDRLTVKEIK